MGKGRFADSSFKLPMPAKNFHFDDADKRYVKLVDRPLFKNGRTTVPIN